MSCEDIVGVGGDTLGVFTSAAVQLAAVAGPAWLCKISPVQPTARQTADSRAATGAPRPLTPSTPRSRR